MKGNERKRKNKMHKKISVRTYVPDKIHIA